MKATEIKKKKKVIQRNSVWKGCKVHIISQMSSEYLQNNDIITIQMNKAIKSGTEYSMLFTSALINVANQSLKPH